MTAVKQTPTTNTPLSMDALNIAYHSPETDCVNNLLGNLEILSNEQDKVQSIAAELVQNVRANRKRFGGIDSFLQEFGLSTQEGIALMCLSEALLRIPDAETADKLIKDKIGSAEWTKHVGQGGDVFVNASTWTLMLTGKVIGDFKDESNEGVSAILGGMVSKLGEPIVRRAMLHTMKILGKQFVMGRSIDEALKRAKPDEKMGYRYSYDMLGEGARTQKDADRYFKSYQDAIDGIGKNAQSRNLVHGTPADVPGISIKLSALHPRYVYGQKDRCIPELTVILKKLALQAAKYNIGLTVDAEEADRLEMSLQIIENVFNDPELGSWNGFGLAIQAYQKRCPQVIDFLIKLCEKNQRRMMIRLVKGAYWDSEIKHAQELGTDEYPVFTRKAATDVSYLACATKLMARRDVFYPQFATHNAHSVACILHLAAKSKDTKGYEFQRLHGMGEPLYHQIVGHEAEKNKTPVRIYAPVGSHEDLLPYLVRRLLENGANSSFVNRIQDDRVSIDDMVADPIEYIAKLEHKPHPKIPLPCDMFGAERQNAYGFDFADSQVSEDLQRKVLDYTKSKTWHAAPLIGGEASMGDTVPVLNPANLNEQAGDVIMASKTDIQNALKATSSSFNAWRDTPAEIRAECLNNMADLLEDNMAELMAICVKEAGKTLPDALSEIREAVDFCRYYAAQGIKNFAKPTNLPGPTGESNQLFLTGRGTILCISPWNFPLAIFLGQVTAALMAGNTVIAKPATQTPLIAMKAVELLIKAGIPADTIALLPVSGRLAGEDLVTHKNIAGIVFTGSTQTAQTINKTLANRTGAIVPFVAETGGQNAMIVDNSALPEQVVDDIIISAFQSAGQRCSALRVLFIQEDIAETVLTMLDGAMQELTFGNPVHLSTDIGPVIDKMALDGLEAHKKDMDKCATLKSAVKLPKACKDGTFCAPVVYELENLSLLKEENFGPILHVIRYKTDDLDSVIDQINATEFGLTLGIHTRIDYVRDKIIARTNVGNSYVNRSMIGAVVGVQPFGGQCLSGTGPKAGGPHYLLRLATEKTITIDTTASGGNTTLVSLSEDDG